MTHIGILLVLASKDTAAKAQEDNEGDLGVVSAG